ncbi:MAG: hypothetical protein ABIN18_05890 [Pseudomonadota bacterium]
MLAKKGEIPYRYPVSRNQYPVSLPNEAKTSLYGDEAVKPKNIILRAIATSSFKYTSLYPGQKDKT